MMLYLRDAADAATDSEVMDIDIVGFSRGAAQAREFVNRVVARTSDGWYRYDGADGTARCQRVNFRFMGLWDTVLSDNWTPDRYQFDIPEQFSYVAHAVALNEYRGHTLPLGRANPLDPHSWGAFPLESIMGRPVPAGTSRIERGFIGAHADVGGGFADNELSRVALAWMIEQAKHAGVEMNTTPLAMAPNPVLHDKSDAIRFGSPAAGAPFANDATWNSTYTVPEGATPGAGAEDRQVRYRDGTVVMQRDMATAGMRFADTERFITYDARRSRSDNVTGTVDARQYVAWLRKHHYDLNYLTVQ